MATISLCMIVRDEEETLERCLSGASGVADEIIIVDTGSTDRTREIAVRYTDKVCEFAWIDDFAAARNYSFDQATMDYILWLDADDLLLPEDAVRLRALKGCLPPEVDAVMLRYNAGFDAQGRVTFSYSRERLVRRERNFRWVEPVHEYLAVFGNVIDTDICVTHGKQGVEPGGRNLRIYERRLEAGESLSPRGMYYYARELRDNGRTEDAAGAFSRFLDDGRGWAEDNICACGELAKCLLTLGDKRGALAALFRSFEYDLPRGELCCQLGYCFKESGSYRQALYWFDTALRLQKPPGCRGFIQEECWGYIPAVECAVCCDRLGEPERAEEYNERAAAFKPDSPAVLYNRAYFANKRQQLAMVKEGKDSDVNARVSGNQPATDAG